MADRPSRRKRWTKRSRPLGEPLPAAGASAALDGHVRHSLPAVFLGVGSFYFLLVVASPFLGGEAGPGPGAGLVWAWSGTAVAGFVGAAALRLRPPPRGWGNALAGALGAVTVLDGLLLVSVAGPAFLFALVAALVAFALFLLSLPWMAGLSVLSMAGWLFLAWLDGGGPEWTPRTINLLAFCILALVAQATRVGLHRRLEALKARDAERAAQRHELERARALSEQRQRIVRTTAHELGTPMTPVLLQVHLLSQADLPPEARQRLETLERNLERLRVTIGKVVAAAQADERAERLYREGGVEAEAAPGGSASASPSA